MGQANFQNKLADVKGCQSTFFGTGVVSMSIRLSTTILVRKGAALFLVRKDCFFFESETQVHYSESGGMSLELLIWVNQAGSQLNLRTLSCRQTYNV